MTASRSVEGVTPTSLARPRRLRTRNVGGMLGAPRKVDHRTGSNTAFASAIAARLPDVTTATRRGVVSYKVDGHVFLTVDPAGREATVHTPEEDAELALGHAGRDEVRE